MEKERTKYMMQRRINKVTNDHPVYNPTYHYDLHQFPQELQQEIEHDYLSSPILLPDIPISYHLQIQPDLDNPDLAGILSCILDILRDALSTDATFESIEINQYIDDDHSITLITFEYSDLYLDLQPIAHAIWANNDNTPKVTYSDHSITIIETF